MESGTPPVPGIGDRLTQLWKEQADQQRALGEDPENLNDIERIQRTNDMVLQLHEEATELGRLAPLYKRHILRLPRTINRAAIAEEVADCLKTVLCIAQLNGLTAEEVVAAFISKTRVVADKAEGERIALSEGTKLICVDIDDVLCDLSPWRYELGIADEREMDAPLKLRASETMKNQFYQGGRFRTMFPVDGAAEGLREISASGVRIALITARPQWQYKRLYADTVHWLAEYGMVYDLLLFTRNKVEALFEFILPAWPAYFVEDDEKNAEKLVRAGVNVLLFDGARRCHLPDGERLRRVSTWKSIVEIVKGTT